MLRRTTFALLTALSVACQAEKQAPQVASSHSNPAYAVTYANGLREVGTRIDEQRQAVDGSVKEMPQFALKVGPSDPKLVASLYEEADEEGRSEAYATRANEERVISSFFQEEENELVQRIAANSEYAAKQKECEVNLSDASRRGLQRGVQDQLRDRRRSTSAAQAKVKQKKVQLGPKAVQVLPDQLDQISLTSYLVYVALETDEQLLAKRVEQIGSIRSTLESHRFDVAADGGDKEELARTDAALVELTKQETSAKETLKDVEARRVQLRKDYEDALDKLVESAKMQPPKK
jgi:hypothetical protein